jgi:hypothetical protein
MKKLITFNFIPHFAIRITCVFIFFTAFGTMTHELGHWAFAKYFGYDTHIDHRSMRYFNAEKENDSLYLEYKKIWEENYQKIQAKETFEQQARWKELNVVLSEKYPPKPKYHRVWITLGGPLQTIFTGFLGLFMLFYRKSKQKEFFVFLDWLGVFLALFVLREVFNFVMAVFGKVIQGQDNTSGDEFKLSYYFELNPWTVPAIGFLIGMVISLYVIFRVIPLKYRFSFILAGLVGGVLGFIIWFGPLGPLLFP